MKNRIKSLAKFFWVWTPFLLFRPGTAAAAPVNIAAGLGNAVSQEALASKVVSIATMIGGFAGGVGLIFFIMAAYQMMTAGNEQSRAAAKQRMTYVLIGIAIIGFAVTAVSFWANFIAKQS